MTRLFALARCVPLAAAVISFGRPPCLSAQATPESPPGASHSGPLRVEIERDTAEVVRDFAKAQQRQDTIYPSDWDERQLRKRHVVLGALAGGAVGGGLAVGLAHGCESNKAIGPSCAIGKLLVVGLSTAMGAIVGAVGGYFWPTRVSP